MIKSSLFAATALVALFLALPAADAAGVSRAWVSGKGTDAAGCGAPTSPCRSFQYVHDNVIAAGGEIDVLDPAGYGPVTITKAVSIVNDGVGTAGVQVASGDAIIINAGANDNVTLRGLNIDGLGTGSRGILLNSAGGLTVTNCVIRHFGNSASGSDGDGVTISPTSGSLKFLISNVIVSDNGNAGILIFPPSGTPTITGAIDRVTAINNFNFGIEIDTPTTGGAVAISNSIASNNGLGIAIENDTTTPLVVSIDNSTISGNQYGIQPLLGNSSDVLTVLLGRSVITSNKFGIDNHIATLYTYGDNRINGNGTDLSGSPLNTADKPQ